MKLILILAFCSIALSQDKPEVVNIRALNSAADDFAPVWNKFDGRLYFSSSRTGFSGFYTARAEEGKDFSFTDVNFLKAGINQERNNQQYLTFESAEKAYLSTFRMTGGRPVQNIFYSNFTKLNWNKPFVLEEIATADFSGMPAISSDGSYMVFSSNRNNPDKDTDLWIVYKNQDGSWGKPYLLDHLNSAGNEITPFLTAGDTLFFSSDGLGGPGGFDIYMADREEGEWKRAEPLNAVNTESDESDLTVLPGNIFLFASNRAGTSGGYDIFGFKAGDAAIADNISPDLELNIEAFTSTITLKNDYGYHYVPADNVMEYAGSEETGLSGEQKKQLDILARSFRSAAINEIILTSFLNGNIELEDSAAKQKNTKYFADSRMLAIKSYLAGQGLDAVVKFNYSTNEGLTDEIRIMPGGREFLPLAEVRDDRIEIEPSKIQAEINFRPREAYKKGEVSLWVGTEKIILADNMEKPGTVAAELKNHAAKIYEADSMKIEFEASDINGKEFVEYLPFLISRSSSSVQVPVKISGRDLYIFPLIPRRMKREEYPGSLFLQKINEKYRSGTSVRIFYVAEDKAALDRITDVLKQALIPSLQIEKIKVEKFPAPYAASGELMLIGIE